MRPVVRAVSLVVLLALAVLLAAPAAAESEGARHLRLQRDVIVDASGFAEPMAAVALLTPYGWRAEGGVRWGAEHACTNGWAFDWTATAPDGSAFLRLLPQQGWESNSYGAGPTNPACPLWPVVGARPFLEARLAALDGAARVLGYRERPDLVVEAGVRVGPIDSGGPIALETSAEGGELRFERAGPGGALQRGLLQGVVQVTITRNPSAFGVLEAVTVTAQPQLLALWPADAFEPATAELVRRSMIADPRWLAALTGHAAAIARDARAIQRREAAFAADARAASERLAREVWTAQAESAERRLREFGEAMRGVRSFDDATAPGGVVEVDVRYDHAFRLVDGGYLVTDDPNFDPWAALNLEAERLTPTR